MSKKLCNVALGRFQPFTKGHLQMLKDGYDKNGYPAVVFIIANKKFDNKHPFSDELISKEMNIVKQKYNFVIDTLPATNADIVKIGQKLDELGYEAHLWLCGEDRETQFKRQAENPKYREQGKFPDDFTTYTGTGRTKGVSGTAVRETIKNNDTNKFKTLMPDGTITLFNEFKKELNAIKESINSLSEYLKTYKTKSLRQCICEAYIQQKDFDNKYYELINEGGMGGHMAHPYEYDELTFGDLKEMINQLFNGDITEIKEKLDGTNIQATVNNHGEVVFIRNKGDLNSENGGMSVNDMANKWADKPAVAKNYIKAGEVIKKIFSKINNKFFNPNDRTRVIVNCECISAGQTNVMLYETDRVAFHGTVTYKKEDSGKWEFYSESEGEPREIREAAKGIKEAVPRPNLIIKNSQAAKDAALKAETALDIIMNDNAVSEKSTIGDYKRIRYNEIAPEWAKNDACFNRIIQQNKTVNLRELKKIYPELPTFEKSKECKLLYKDIMEPLDTFFAKTGNALISLLDGFTNAGNEDKVIKFLKTELEKNKEYVNKNGTDEMKDVMTRSLQRLIKLDNKLNATEGVVFQYKGKLMKLTGTFAAFNQALGIKFMK